MIGLSKEEGNSGTEEIFEVIMPDNFPKLMTNTKSTENSKLHKYQEIFI